MIDRHFSSGRLALAALLVAASSGTVFAQLPDGPGKDTVQKVCGVCHDPTTAASVRLTREGWQGTIGDMVSRGAKGTDEELTQILDYLSTHFLGEADKPLNMNTATAIELESVLGLLRRESAALIAYRTKQNGFTSLEDLKKAPGVPFKKIEAAKDRLVFGIVAKKPE
ncbi:MAG: helix-hairpin-helix domain-containing protein [Acidobacteriota bacterium]